MMPGALLWQQQRLHGHLRGRRAPRGPHRTDKEDGLENFHLCCATLEFSVEPSDNQYGDLTDVPGVNMENVARLFLQEIFHHSTVGSESGVGQIVDTQNSDGIVAHYPQRTHALVEGNSGLVTTNADSHARCWRTIHTIITLHQRRIDLAK
ncbi:hypothetical protein DL765_000831 [Monosporascus sp. GIB2]|nr:hypothetical protein DL765_000831 [Monosporascus sp. GIB2]